MKKLFLVFGFVLFFVSCGGGNPIVISSNWRLYLGEENWVETETGANTLDAIVPDITRETLYMELSGVTAGTQPANGASAFINRVLLSTEFCQISHNVTNDCNTNGTIEHNGIVFGMAHCSWMEDWQGNGSDFDIPTANPGTHLGLYCDFYRYDSDFNLWHGAKWHGSEFDNIYFFDAEKLFWDDDFEGGDSISYTVTYTAPGEGLQTQDYDWRIRQSSTSISFDANSYTSWYMVPSGPSNTNCGNTPGISKDFGPLIGLNRESYWQDLNPGGASQFGCPTDWPANYF